LERQHRLFIVVASGAFAALILAGFLFNPISKTSSIASSSNNNNIKNKEVIKVRVGEPVDIIYSPTVGGMIQGLPRTNNVTITMSSELQNINFVGLKGQIKYANELIKYIQNGKIQTITGNNFKTIEYKFSPDTGNQTRYTFEDVQYVSNNGSISNADSGVIVSVIPLSTAKVGEHYTVKMDLNTGGLVNYEISEKTIEIIS
jgi:hypothetical protein